MSVESDTLKSATMLDTLHLDVVNGPFILQVGALKNAIKFTLISSTKKTFEIELCVFFAIKWALSLQENCLCRRYCIHEGELKSV